MKRFLPLLLLALMLATLTGGVVAQDATPEAGDSLISGLGYPVIEYTTDGTTLSGPTELTAGRYLLKVVNTSAIEEWDMSFYSSKDDMTVDDLLAQLSAVDTQSGGAPDIFYQIGHNGGVSSPATEAIVQLSAGEYVAAAMFFSEPGGVATQKVTVTGDLPEFAPIAGAVEVTLADMSIDLPDTLDAGPQIWQVTSTGALPHFVQVMKSNGELTNEEAVNGIKLVYGMADATPAADGSVQDPMSWEDIAGSPTITGGVTTIFEMDLEPGTYIAFCFIEGPGDLGSHALHGMTRVFTVK